MLKRAVEGVACRSEIGARQAHIAKSRAVRATANRLYVCHYTAVCRRLYRVVDEVHARNDLLLHIAVLLLDGKLYRALAVLLVECLCDMRENLLARFKHLKAVVADDVIKRSSLNATAHTDSVIKSLVATRLGGNIRARKKRVYLHSNEERVYHNVLCRAWVNVHSVYHEMHAAGVEVLVFKRALFATVNGVSEISAKSLNVKVIRAAADLLVGSKADKDPAVSDLARLKSLNERHYLGNACLVVSAEQSSSVGGDERSALELGQMREHLGREDSAAISELYLAAVVVFNYLRIDALAAEVGRGVHVRDKA